LQGELRVELESSSERRRAVSLPLRQFRRNPTR
jgi:hypothetical protein